MVSSKSTASRQLGLACLVLLFSLLGGCRSRLIKVSGDVTMDGEAVANGHVLLIPVDADVAVSAGEIRDGRFEFETTAGKKKVEIRASRFRPDIKNPMGPVFREYIPSSYNSQTQLAIEVGPTGQNHFDFALVSRKAGRTPDLKK